MSETVKGTVKWFNEARGYGFLSQPEGEDIFVHYTAIQGNGFRTLKEGQEVDVKVIEIKDGKISLSIKTLLENPEEPAADEGNITIPESEGIGISLGDLLKGFKLG